MDRLEVGFGFLKHDLGFHRWRSLRGGRVAVHVVAVFEVVNQALAETVMFDLCRRQAEGRER
jgi:hypothetical protein